MELYLLFGLCCVVSNLSHSASVSRANGVMQTLCRVPVLHKRHALHAPFGSSIPQGRLEYENIIKYPIQKVMLEKIDAKGRI